MASLMDSLLDVLKEEEKEYHVLIDLAWEKKDVLIRADIDRLSKITE